MASVRDGLAAVRDNIDVGLRCGSSSLAGGSSLAVGSLHGFNSQSRPSQSQLEDIELPILEATTALSDG